MGQLDMATETGRGQISVVPMRGTRFMDTNLTHEREAPKRDNRNMDETNLPERDYVHMDETNQTVSKHKPTIYEGEDDQNSQDGEVEMMTHESQPGSVCSHQPVEKEQHVSLECKRKEGPSPLSTLTRQADNEQGEVRMLTREKRPRKWLTYKTLGQPLIHANVDSLTSQMGPMSTHFTAYIPGQVILPFTLHMYIPHTYYTPVTTSVY